MQRVASVETNPFVAKHLLCHLVGFGQTAVQHGQYAMFLAGGKQFFQSGDGGTQSRVGRFQHIIPAQFFKGEVAKFYGLFQLTVVCSPTGCPVQCLVVQDNHNAVFGIMYVAFYSGVSETFCHAHGFHTVFRYKSFQPATAVGNHGGVNRSFFLRGTGHEQGQGHHEQ